jgi:hypothetical protein
MYEHKNDNARKMKDDDGHGAARASLTSKQSSSKP